LRSLTPKFEHVVAAIEEANDISKMTVRLLSGSLRAHEQHMNNNKIEKPIEQALQAQVSIGRSYHKHGTLGGHNHIVVKVVVAIIMQALSKTTLVPITIQVQIALGAVNMDAEDEEAFIINQILCVIIVINTTIMQMNADQNVIIMLSMVLKKIVITNKRKHL